jgi:hypothetical protein
VDWLRPLEHGSIPWAVFPVGCRRKDLGHVDKEPFSLRSVLNEKKKAGVTAFQ